MIAIQLPFFLALLLFLQTSVRALPATQSDAALPTMDQLRQMEAAGQYPSVVRNIALILNGGQAALSQYDQYDLFMLKAEAHIQLRSNEEAQSAFTMAMAHSGDLKKRAMAHAMAELVRKSPRMIYHHPNPHPGVEIAKDDSSSETFDVTQAGEEQRKAVLSALFDDEWTAAQPAAKAALATTQSITPIFKFGQVAVALRDIELAATGKNEKCRKLFGDIVAHAQELLDPSLSAMKTQVEDIQKRAEKVLDVTQEWDAAHNRVPGKTYTPGPNGQVAHANKHYRLQGFTGDDAGALQNDVDQCQALTAGLAQLIDSLGDPAGGLAKDSKDATTLYKRAEKVLNRDYNTVVTDPKSFHLSDKQ